MTGYGKSEGSIEIFLVTIEIKSVNNRFLDINLRAPSSIQSFEPELREMVKAKINRGKINVFIDIKENKNIEGNFVNHEKLSALYKALLSVKNKLNIPGEVQLSHLLQFPDLMESDFSEINEEVFKTGLRSIFKIALDALIEMRLKEGAHLISDMNDRLNAIRNAFNDVREKSQGEVKNEFNLLVNRIEELLENKTIDRDRLEQEIALISDKVDITEEIIRFESHLIQFEQTLKRDSELGKKLIFILQEMHREANTINSKTTNVEVSHKIIQVKEEIEKIREQAQNIE